MHNMDLDIVKETIAEMANLRQTSDDLSVEDVSQIVFSTFVDLVGESLAENALASLSDDLANFIFEHDVPNLSDPIESISIDRLDSELEEIIAQNLRASLPATSDDPADEEATS